MALVVLGLVPVLGALSAPQAAEPLFEEPAVAVYSVDAMGATSGLATDDDTPGIQAAIDAAIHFANASGETAVVQFHGGGEYWLKTGKRGRGHLDLSCADGRGQVILRGQGATLMVETPRLGLFFAEGSKAVSVEELRIELAAAPHIGCRVVSVNAESRVVTAQPFPGSTALADFPGYSEEWGWIHDDTVLHRPKAGVGSSFHAKDRIQEEVDGPVRFTIDNGVPMGQFAVGDVLSFHYRRGNNFRFQNCEDIELHGVLSFGSGLFFVSTSHVSGLRVADCAVLVKPGRVQATNGDGVHLKYCRNVEIRDCYLEGLSDDGVNVTGTFGFDIQRCVFANKRRHAIAFDTDGAMYRSRSGGIVDCAAYGNGGSFMHYDGGDYSTVHVEGNRAWENGLTTSGSRVEEPRRCVAVQSERELSWGRDGSVRLVRKGGLAEGLDGLWCWIRVPTPRGPRIRIKAQSAAGPQPWLFLAGDGRVEVTRSVRTTPRRDPRAALIDAQVWIEERVGNGTFRLLHELSGEYLGLSSSGDSALTMTPDGAQALTWKLLEPGRQH